MAISFDISNIFGSGPRKLDGPRDNPFDRLAKDFDAPLLSDLFGADATADREAKDAETARKKKELTAATGVDIDAFVGGGLPDAQASSDLSGTSRKILEAVLAGKPASSIFGGDV
jgi:hypothetical protein